RGGFLPPLPHRRRMFAGGRLTFAAPILIGSTVRRKGEVVAVQEKTGGRGELVVVTVRYEISDQRGLLVAEEQDLVYTDSPPQPPQPGSSEVPDAPWSESIMTDEVLLFRFSALTFNSHRIHYDRTYATGNEGYPGLLVHGTLTALLCAEMLRSHATRPPTRFSFRTTAPLYVGETIQLRGGPSAHDAVRLAAYRDDGAVAVEAHATVG
ncbi:MAG: acyl-CoA dehydrogenase, partial [Actinobacteria bacterium]